MLGLPGDLGEAVKTDVLSPVDVYVSLVQKSDGILLAGFLKKAKCLRWVLPAEKTLRDRPCSGHSHRWFPEYTGGRQPSWAQRAGAPGGEETPVRHLSSETQLAHHRAALCYREVQEPPGQQEQ